MVESIFSIIYYGIYIFIIGIIIYTFILSSDTNKLTEHFKQEEEYEKYLEKNHSKKFEFRIIDDYQDYSNIEEIQPKEEAYAREELDLCIDFIRKTPKNIYAISRRAFINSSLQRYDEAIDDYNYLMKKEPKEFSYVEYCASMHAYLNNTNTALTLINNFYKNKKRDAQYFHALGTVFHITKDYEYAIKNLTEAIKLDYNNPYYYYERANTYKEMGDEDKYQQDMEQHDKLNKIPYEKRSEMKNPFQNNKPNYKSIFKNPTIYKILSVCIILFLIIYFHPTKEILHCNMNRTCKAERTYFGIYKTYKTIKLNPNSSLSCKTGMYSSGKHSSRYGLYIRIDGIAPFVFYVADSASGYGRYHDNLNRVCSIHKENFQKYINYYEIPSFTIESKADTTNFLFSLIFTIFIICIFFAEDITKIIKNKKSDKK